MTQNDTPPPSNATPHDASDAARDTADRVDRAVGSMDRAAASVQSNVASGIQPDLRELRLLMGDLRDTVAISFRRIFWAVIACIALNIAVLLVLLAR